MSKSSPPSITYHVVREDDGELTLRIAGFPLVMPSDNLWLKNQSIQKWELVLQQAKKVEEPIHPGGPNTCAFCLVYIGHACRECPIRLHTGLSGCEDTPWDWFEDRNLRHANFDTYLQYVQKELEFLRALPIND